MRDEIDAPLASEQFVRVLRCIKNMEKKSYNKSFDSARAEKNEILLKNEIQLPVEHKKSFPQNSLSPSPYAALRLPFMCTIIQQHTHIFRRKTKILFL